MDKQLGYIVESVISQNTQTVKWNGKLEVLGLESWLTPPLVMNRLEIQDIRRICCTQESCECYLYPKEKERIQILFFCTITDTCGRSMKGIARIEVPICAAPCTGNVRRGAKMLMKCAQFCGGNTFDVCMEICIYTVVSRCEYLRTSKQPEQCRQLPLYPHVSFGCWKDLK